jgi:hypothetical protein
MRRSVLVVVSLLLVTPSVHSFSSNLPLRLGVSPVPIPEKLPSFATFSESLWAQIDCVPQYREPGHGSAGKIDFTSVWAESSVSVLLANPQRDNPGVLASAASYLCFEGGSGRGVGSPPADRESNGAWLHWTGLLWTLTLRSDSPYSPQRAFPSARLLRPRAQPGNPPPLSPLPRTNRTRALPLPYEPDAHLSPARYEPDGTPPRLTPLPFPVRVPLLYPPPHRIRLVRGEERGVST